MTGVQTCALPIYQHDSLTISIQVKDIYTLTKHTSWVRYNVGKINVFKDGIITNETSFVEGTELTLLAEPTVSGNQETDLQKFRFARWRGDAEGTNHTITIHMDKHKIIEAEFMAIYNRIASFKAIDRHGYSSEAASISPLNIETNYAEITHYSYHDKGTPFYTIYEITFFDIIKDVEPYATTIERIGDRTLQLKSNYAIKEGLVLITFESGSTMKISLNEIEKY